MLKSGKNLTGVGLNDNNKKDGFIAYVGVPKPYHNDIKTVPDGSPDNTNKYGRNS